MKKMKKIIISIAAAIVLLFAGKTKAQTNDVIYSVIFNSVYDNYPLPMIGFINVAHGNLNTFQLGFVNATQLHNSAAQIGFVNTTGSINGAQFGYINNSRRFVNGFQGGFVNAAGAEVNGFQAGFVNVSGQWLNGFQAGFVNATRRTVDGFQAGYVNVAGENLDGAQFGFVNATAKDVDGAQFGFVNVASKLNGLQLGFVNVVDSVVSGAPIGFLSIVRKGGYKAFGVYADEMFPVNLSFRIGVKSFYTNFVLSHNNTFDNKFALGAGVGAFVDMNDRLFLNPEFMSQSSINTSLLFQQNHILNISLGYKLTRNLHFAAGPSLVWSYSNDLNNIMEPYVSIYDFAMSGRNRMHIGARASMYVSF